MRLEIEKYINQYLIDFYNKYDNNGKENTIVIQQKI